MKNPVPVSLTVTEQIIDHAATGLLFRKLRRDAGVSLRALADEMGKSAPYLGDLELGRRNWSNELFEEANAALRRISK